MDRPQGPTEQPEPHALRSRAFSEHEERVRVAFAEAVRREAESAATLAAALAEADALAEVSLACACGCGRWLTPETLKLAAKRKQRRIYATVSCRFRARELRNPQRRERPKG